MAATDVLVVASIFVDTFIVDRAKQEDVVDAIIAEIDPDPADDRPGAEAEAVQRRAGSLP
ncbi:hypothetical protein HFO96_31820 [Rhizobium leguminosarum]|nr:hypothetical protein [Rhizobium leguminosarum]MBY5351800.1 hypothetical protein [Rhizobium leguminosarum]